MSSAAVDAASGVAKSGGGRKKLLILGAPLLLAGIGAGVWFSGILQPLLGHGDKAAAEKSAIELKPAAPVFIDLPEMISNLDTGARKASYVKLKARLELTKPDDIPLAQAAMPRLQDLFQTYLREMRPEELRGATGTYRLREELIARSNLAMPGVHVQNVLFTEIIVQ